MTAYSNTTTEKCCLVPGPTTSLAQPDCESLATRQYSVPGPTTVYDIKLGNDRLTKLFLRPNSTFATT